MDDIERIRERRDNVEAIEPIITSMRTIAAGGWRQALARRQSAQFYCRYLEHAMGVVAAGMPLRDLVHTGLAATPRRAHLPLVLVISSQRGLCGAYNDAVARGAEEFIVAQSLTSDRVTLGTLGARAALQLRRTGREIDHEWPLPTSRVADMALVRSVAAELQEELDAEACDAIYVVYSPYRADTVVPPVAERWLPVDLTMLPQMPAEPSLTIVEGEPVALMQQLVSNWALGRLYRMVMEAAASEQAARYRAMETASSNLQRMTEELTLQYHSARQNAITMEMLDLAAGAEGSRSRPNESDH